MQVEDAEFVCRRLDSTPSRMVAANLGPGTQDFSRISDRLQKLLLAYGRSILLVLKTSPALSGESPCCWSHAGTCDAKSLETPRGGPVRLKTWALRAQVPEGGVHDWGFRAGEILASRWNMSSTCPPTPWKNLIKLLEVFTIGNIDDNRDAHKHHSESCW